MIKRIKMNKKTYFLFLIIMFLNFFTFQAFAITIDPGEITRSLGNQIDNFFKWYTPVDFVIDEKTGQITPVLDETYLLGRRIIDFIFIFTITGLILRKSPIKDRYGEKVLWIFAAVMSLSFVLASKIGLIASLFPFVSVIPFILVVYIIYNVIVKTAGEKATPVVKIIIFLLAIVITYFIFYQLNNIPYLKGFTKMPGVDKSGFIEQAKIEERIIGEQPIITVDENLKKDKELFKEAQQALEEAEKLYNEGKYEEAMDKVNIAEQKNTEGYSLIGGNNEI